MFHFPGFASTALWIQAGMTGFSTLPGFPIRRPPDRSLVGGSPRHFAATRVLHRLLAPRHPSRALSSLQFSNFSCPPSLALPRSVDSQALALPPSQRKAYCSSWRLKDLLELLLFEVLQSKSNSPTYSLLSKNERRTSGADRARTGDVQLAKLALSQLSYSPRRKLAAARPPDVTSGPG